MRKDKELYCNICKEVIDRDEYYQIYERMKNHHVFFGKTLHIHRKCLTIPTSIQTNVKED